MMLRARSLLALCLLAPACSDPPPAAPSDAGVDAATERGPAVRFNLPAAGIPQPLEVPFPTDLYRTDPDGTITDALADWSLAGVSINGGSFTEGYGALDGFGRNAGAIFRVEGDDDLDPASLPATSEATLGPDAAVALVDVDPRSPTPGARVPCLAGWTSRFRTLVVQPDGVPLAPGRTYAAVVTRAVRTTRGDALRAAPAFAAIRDDAPGARSTPAGMLYGGAADRVATLAGPSFDRRAIVGLAVFTTQTTHRQLRVIRDALVGGRHGPAPQLDMDPMTARPYGVARFGARAHAGWTATLDAWLGAAPRGRDGMELPGERHGSEPTTTGMAHDAIGVVLTGTFVSPEFRRPYTGTTDRGDGTFAPDAAPVDAAKRIPVTLVLPRGAPPPGGWPVVIYGHGLGGQRQQLLNVANELARVGVATAGIDTATFGQRARGREADTLSLYPGTYQGPDGLPDLPSYDQEDFFGGLSNILALRDNFRQTALDYVQLRRLLANPALDLSSVAAEYDGATPRLDGAHVGYVGNSLGGILGTLFAAVEPEANPFVLNVPGGGVLTALCADSPVIGGTLRLAGTIVFRYPGDVAFDRFHPLTNLIQGVADGADPASYGEDVTAITMGRGHDVWVTEAEDDEVIPNRSTELLARAMRLPQVMPTPRLVAGLRPTGSPVRGNVEGRTQALTLQAPATHGGNLATRYGTRSWVPPFPRAAGTRFVRATREVRVRQPIVGYQRAVARFFRGAFMGAAEIDAAGLSPLLDWDDDGWTDAEERAMSTDPYDPTSVPPGAAPHPRDVGF